MNDGYGRYQRYDDEYDDDGYGADGDDQDGFDDYGDEARRRPWVGLVVGGLVTAALVALVLAFTVFGDGSGLLRDDPAPPTAPSQDVAVTASPTTSTTEATSQTPEETEETEEVTETEVVAAPTTATETEEEPTEEPEPTTAPTSTAPEDPAPTTDEPEPTAYPEDPVLYAQTLADAWLTGDDERRDELAVEEVRESLTALASEGPWLLADERSLDDVEGGAGLHLVRLVHVDGNGVLDLTVDTGALGRESAVIGADLVFEPEDAVEVDPEAPAVAYTDGFLTALLGQDEAEVARLADEATAQQVAGWYDPAYGQEHVVVGILSFRDEPVRTVVRLPEAPDEESAWVVQLDRDLLEGPADHAVTGFEPPGEPRWG